MKWIISILLIALSLHALPAVAEGAGDQILGVWHTTDDKGQVQIFKVKNR